MYHISKSLGNFYAIGKKYFSFLNQVYWVIKHKIDLSLKNVTAPEILS